MKLSKLLPFVGVATIVAPTVTLVSCSSGTYLSEYHGPVPMEFGYCEYLQTEKPMNLKQDVEYTFNVDLGKFKNDSRSEAENLWLAAIVWTSMWVDDCPPMLEYRVWIGNKELALVTDTEHGIVPGEFSYQLIRDGSYALEGPFGDEITNKEKMKIKIKVPNDLDNVYFTLAHLVQEA